MIDYNDESKAFSNGKDSIAVRNYVGGIMGGVFLDTTDYPTANTTIPILSVVVRNTTTGICAVLPIASTGNYSLTTSGDSKVVAAPTGTEIIGVTVATVVAGKPAVGVMNAGEINENCLPFCAGNGTTSANLAQLKAALKDALPALILNHD